MKTLIISTLIICSSKINSQINVDSLFDYIQSSNLFYSPKQHKSLYLLNTFSNYTKKDSSEEYYVYLDSNKKLSSFLDLCILYEKFDSKKRLLKKVGYSRKGFLSFYDFPPYIENIYKTDTSIELIYDKDYTLRSKKIKIFNKNSQVVEETTLSDNYYIQELSSYSNNFERTISRYDEKGNKIQFEKGVYYLWQKTDEKNEVIEQKYYDISKKLINGNHYYNQYNKVECSFSKFILKKEGYQEVYYFYNDKDELICSFDGVFVYKPGE